MNLYTLLSETLGVESSTVLQCASRFLQLSHDIVVLKKLRVKQKKVLTRISLLHSTERALHHFTVGKILQTN